MYDFIREGNEKEEIRLRIQKDDSLESKLETLKSMKDKGVITDEIYMLRVSNIFKENCL